MNTAPTREEIRAAGFRQICGSSDLFHVGYTVRHWLRVSDWAEWLEYLPRLSDGPRYVARDYGEQCMVHGTLGLSIVPPGCTWERNGQQPLFPY